MGKIKKFINKKKHNLRFIIIFYFTIVFVAFIIGFELFTYFSLRDYYYNTIKNNMIAQSAYSVELYDSSISEYSLSEVVSNQRLEFLTNIQGRVQILDNTGVLYYDNTGDDRIGEVIQNTDQLTGINFEYHNDNILSLNYPIKTNYEQIGVLRTITSLDEVNKEIALRMSVFLIFGVITVLIGGLLIYIIGGRILTPINKLISYANKLSDGQYKSKSNMSYDGEIGELARVMDEMSENIVNKEQIKTEFISSVSHELRTPLTSIKGWAITLQDGDIDQDVINEGLKIIEKESDRLSDMVEDLLDFSRFTSPKFSLTKTEFNLIPIVKNIINQLKPRTLEKNITMVFDYDLSLIHI